MMYLHPGGYVFRTVRLIFQEHAILFVNSISVSLFTYCGGHKRLKTKMITTNNIDIYTNI